MVTRAVSQAIATRPRNRFPDKLRDYVRRTFEDCRLGAWLAVETELKRIITGAFNEQVVWSLDWDRVPLPQESLATKAFKAARDKGNTVPDAGVP